MLLAHNTPTDSTRIGDAASLVALLGASWAITEQGRQQVVAVVTHALQGREALPLRATRTATIRDGVAVLPVAGPLFKDPAWWGGSDYTTMLRDFNAALEDKAVKAVVLDVDSPGGLTAGCQEFAAAVYAARGKKPIVAYVGGMCASAAYWIASAADRIVATPTALVGSIGCFTTLVDDSEFLSKIGVKLYDVANEQSPFKVLDASKAGDRDRVRAMVTQLASVFIGAVAKHRGVSEDRVEAKFGKGDVLVAAAALTVGMVDALGDFESLVTGLAKTPDSTSSVTAAKVPAPLRVVKSTSKSAPSVRAEKKGKEQMADMKKLKEHASALHDAIHSDEADGDAEKACKMAAPHMKALYAEMGEYAPDIGKKDDEDEDEDDKEAKSFVKSLGGVKALKGSLAASEKIVARVGELEKQVATAHAEKAATELKAMLDEATIDGRIAPAERAEAEKFHAEIGSKAFASYLAKLPKKPTAAVQPAMASNAAAPAAALMALSAEEQNVCKLLGIKPDDYAAFKAPYARYLGEQKKADSEQKKDKD